MPGIMSEGSVVDYRHRLLPDDTEAPAVQFVGQDCLIDGFQQARSQLGVNAKSRVHDLLGDGVLGHTGPSIVSRQDGRGAKKVPGEADSRYLCLRVASAAPAASF